MLIAITPSYLTGTYFGIIVGMALYGLCFAQYLNYLMTFKEDKLGLKLFVSFMMLVNTTETVLEIAVLYGYLMNDSASTTPPAMTSTLLDFVAIIIGITSCSVQLFLAHRVYKFTENLYATISVCLAALVSLSGEILAAAMAHRDILVTGATGVLWSVSVWAIGSILADGVITCTLVWYLCAKRSGMRATEDLVGKITSLTIRTGALTTACAILILICSHIEATIGMGLHMFLNMIVAKLYVITLLSLLNARTEWQRTLRCSVAIGGSQLEGFRGQGIFDATKHLQALEFRTSGYEDGFTRPSSTDLETKDVSGPTSIITNTTVSRDHC